MTDDTRTHGSELADCGHWVRSRAVWQSPRVVEQASQRGSETTVDGAHHSVPHCVALGFRRWDHPSLFTRDPKSLGRSNKPGAGSDRGGSLRVRVQSCHRGIRTWLNWHISID